MTSSAVDATALDNVFSCETSTHKFSISWTALGPRSGHPLIFIHGTPWSSRVWTPYALALSRHYRVYLFDNPGFGESPLEHPLPDKTVVWDGEVERLDSDLARQSEAFAALLRYWQEIEVWQTSPHIVAHDHGGLMSLRTILFHHCQYASLCLIDVVAIGPFGKPLFKSVVRDPHAFENLPNIAFEGILESYIRNAAHFELEKKTMEMLKAPWMEKGGKRGFVRQLCQAAHRTTDGTEEWYAEIGKRVAIKIIWGKQDNWIPVDDAHRLSAALGAKEVVEIDGAGHLLMYDQPGQLGVEIAMWLASFRD